MDLVARIDVTIQPHQVGMVPLNIALSVPDDHWVLLAARSSLHKKGVLMANGIGIGDHDFSGDNDEYQAALLNFTDTPVTIPRGERIAQMMIMPRERVAIKEVESLGKPDRGGFGSTG
jgi:dUTP pyrophosphatase